MNPPKPTKLKILRGNPGKRALNQREPNPKAFTEPPEPPEFLNERAAAEWRYVAPKLMGQGLLTDVDLANLGGYCAMKALAEQAADEMKAQALINASVHGEYINPLLKVQDMALKQMRAFAAEFGMSPSSRSRVKVPEPAKDADPFEAWQNRRKG